MQSHFDELNEFLLSFSSPPSVIFISETRINVEPLINVNIPGYTFRHLPSNTRAGGVGAYFLENLTVHYEGNFGFNIEACENLCFVVEFPGQKQKFTLAVICRHPHNNTSEFINALDEKLNIFDKEKSNKVYILGDINIDLNSNNLSSSYLRMLQSHMYFSLITKPILATVSSQTVIDHILTNDCRSLITPGVFSYKISDPSPISVSITHSNINKTNSNAKYFYRNII